MKKFIKLLAVALAAAALAGCSLVSINTEKITVATVGEDTITKAAFDEGFNAFLSQYGYTQDSTEIADQLPDLKEQYINMMVQNLVIEQKIEELGLGEVTDEEKAAAEQSVQDWYDEQFAQLVETYSADETVEDPEAEATTTIENYLSYYGTTLEQMKQEEVDYIPTQKLYDEVTKDITVTEEQIESQFATLVSEAKTEYDEDKSAFVTDYQSGNTIYYTPEGMFFVKHILIGLTEERKKTVVTGIEMFRKLLDYAEAGDNIGALLRGIQRTEIERGQVLCKPGSINPHTKFHGQVYVLTKEEGGRHTPFFNNYRPQFYFRTTDVTGVITLPEGTEMCMPGDNVEMDVELITPIAIEEGLRFAIREGGRTVGSGVVVKVNE